MSPAFNLLVVCGPTASGKTALAVTLSRERGGEIISADSRQVYRGLDIGSGKDLHEYSVAGTIIPYHLIDIADPHEIYTLFHFQHDFFRAFEEVTGRGHLPVLCGGTGLYIEAVLRSYAIPAVSEDRALRLKLMKLGHAELEAMLLDLDRRVYRKTDLSSKKRIVRAIEVTMHCPDVSASDKRGSPRPGITPFILCTRWERAVLHQRIDRRLDERLSTGMIQEVQRLRESGVPDERLLMLGMEYRHITRHLRGETGYDAMVEALRRSIRQLAKRQETYFRGMERRGCEVHWIDQADAPMALAKVSGIPSIGFSPAMTG